jgi:hypothetical protein
MAEASDLSTGAPGSASDSFDKESHPTLKSCDFPQVKMPPQVQVHMYDGGKDAWMTVAGT